MVLRRGEHQGVRRRAKDGVVTVQFQPGGSSADQAKVANGASDFLVELLGDPGRPVRAAVGVSELPLNLQPKLLRALEERRFRRVGGTDEIETRCRLIASSNGSFEDALSDGRFREDLFYRLNVLRISIPPLAERGDDQMILARHFMEQISNEMGMAPKPFSADAIDVLKLHNWPGNVRELKNVIQRAIALCDGPEINATHLSIFDWHANRDGRDDDLAQAILIPDIGMTLAEVEAEALRITLRLTRGNRSAAARILAISRPTIHRKIRDYGLEDAV